MSRVSTRALRASLLSLVVASVLPFAALAQTDAVDLTASFVKRGAVIADLSVFQISDIVIIRGATNDRAKAIEAGRIAMTLGYLRVANLIVVVDDEKADAIIISLGRRQLELEPALDGCRFRIDSNRGVIRLTGRVHRDSQRDLAVSILNKIDGVKSVRADLARL
jgi:osmotically-inducible protein OsmY